MKPCFRSTATVACVLFGLLAGKAHAAPPRAVESFDARTWQTLRATLKQPTIVVFSATWCPNCPAVIEELVQDIRQRQLKAQLVAVVMDVAPGEKDSSLLAHAHYRMADRLLAFDGSAAALRHGVDKQWRGATPYVVFLDPKRPPRVVTGPPTEDDVDHWAAGAGHKH